MSVRKLFFILIFLKASSCVAQNLADTIIIPIGRNDRVKPVTFYDSMISDTLKGYIVVGVRLNTSLGDTSVNLSATNIYVNNFRLNGLQYGMDTLKMNVYDISKLSELSAGELRLYKTYSEKMINLYWKQPYNSLKGYINSYGNVSGISFGCPFVIIPKKIR